MAEQVRSGKTTATALVEACLKRIAERESVIGAWAYLDPELALRQAEQADRRVRAGAPLGALHGVPVGIKDIFDTADMPTENGTVLHAGRTPAEDAAAVALLRAAGAVIMGKTTTTELAVYTPTRTRNPRHPEHTPGGSSSGSAAAVADGMVPLAIGSQTNGSVVRPGAYCGVYGYKPTPGLIPLKGALAQSRPLDTAGVFANSVADAAFLAEQIMSPGEQGARLLRPTLLATALQEPPAKPRLAFVKTPIWPNAEPDTQEAFTALAERLSDCVSEVALPDWAGDGLEWHRIIMESDLARSFHREYDTGRDRLSARLRGMIESGQAHRAVDYNNARDRAGDLGRALDEIFADYDAILTPATTGTAPHGLAQTGSPMFCTLWTLCGVPAITLPLLKGANGLPLGVQLVGARADDGRLLRTARWLVSRVGEAR